MKKGIIVASFGSSYRETRELAIEPIENRIRDKYYGEYDFLRVFTSNMIIRKLKKRDQIEILTPKEGVEEMKKKEIEKIYIQPTHIIPGFEYEKLLNLGAKVGKPLLADERDYDYIADNLEILKEKADKTIVFMGHGSEHIKDNCYSRLEKKITSKGYDVYIATVEGEKTIEDVLLNLEARGIKNVVLTPLMLVAGDHAINDMASDEEDSWKTILEEAGIQVEVVLRGLGEYKSIQDLFMKHLEELMEEDQWKNYME